MLAYIFRTVAGFLIGYIMREAMRLMYARGQRYAAGQPESAKPEPPQPPTRSQRFQIDPDNIVDGEFKQISDSEIR